MNYAIKEANETGGCAGLPFRLIPCWDLNPWGTGVTKLARMVFDQNPLAIIGSVDSPSTHLAEQITAKANLPLISPIATDKTATLAGVSWMFSCATADNAIAKTLVPDILAELKNSRHKLALVACADHESRMTTREIMQELSRNHHLPDFRFDFKPGSTSGQALQSLKQSGASVILVVASAEDSAHLIKEIRSTIPSAILFASHTCGRNRFIQLAGQEAEGLRLPVLWTPNLDHELTLKFQMSFIAANGYSPDYADAFAYDAITLLIQAIRKAGPSRVQVRETLGQLSPWQGIAGAISFDGTGQNTRTNVSMGVFHNGAITKHSSLTSISH